ncbi:YceI family protein [Bermanella sp. WJH001]|uniref:YceI family protein n=1 Tax=Bermanella sp. WJH001 TaxID=3048005 RepID=UPI0024BEF9A4|nr:YceI family protein [Bermanella sp. WJH001]MDJ1536842.1 YceI family protein [Bermanella sp. WJH001]
MNKIGLLAVIVLFFSSNVFAQWTLSPDESTLKFISIKKNTIAEVSQFKEFEGSIDKAGKVNISVDLSSVDSKIGIRDQRLKSILFNVAKYSHATLKGTVDVTRASKMKAGEFFTDLVTLNLSLHGVDKDVIAEVTVVKLNDERWLISSAKPVIINAADFGMVEGINSLRELAGLSSIATAIPVTFEFIFNAG